MGRDWRKGNSMEEDWTRRCMCKAYVVGQFREMWLEAPPSRVWGAKESGLLKIYFLLEGRKLAT